ncbi:MAG: ABC transporter permease [Thermoproteota archaeon]
MLKGLRNMVLKELKELIRDPKILLGMLIFPVLMLPLMGGAVRVSTQTAMESFKTLSIGVVDRDSTALSQMFISFLNSSPSVAKVTVFQNIEEAKEQLEKYSIIGIIEIPQEFSSNITRNEKGRLEIYTLFKGGSVFGSLGASILVNLANNFGDYLIVQKVREKIPGFERIVLNPVYVSEKTIVKGEEVPISSSVLSTILAQQSIGLIFGPTMLIFFAMQLGAASTASEKEDKTLETLLTMPIDRITILIGKLSSVILASAISALAFIASWNYYMTSFFEGVSQDQINISLESLGLAPTLPMYVMTGVSLFLTILFALTLSVLISSFAEDVRSAEALIGYMYPILFIPMFLLMFTDINTLPILPRITMWLLPFIHPSLTLQTLFNGDYLTPSLGICYVAILTVIVLYLAARFFSTGRILTAKIRFKKRKAGE